MEGKLYIMASPGWAEGLLKIGKTTRSAKARSVEIDTTGVPDRIIVLHEEPVQDVDLSEIWVHQKLSEYRVRDNREFFNISVSHAIEVLKSAIRFNGTERQPRAWRNLIIELISLPRQ